MNAVIRSGHLRARRDLARVAATPLLGALLVSAGCASSPAATSSAATPSAAPAMAAAPTGPAPRPISSAASPSPDPRIGLKAGLMDAGEALWNMKVVSKTPPSAEFVGHTNSDLAFTGKYAIQGNYNG
jgi:hypothetical protein